MSYRRFDRARAKGDLAEALRLALVHVTSPNSPAIAGEACRFLCFSYAILFDADAAYRLRIGQFASGQPWRSEFVYLPLMRRVYERAHLEGCVSYADILALRLERDAGSTKELADEDETRALIDTACEFGVLEQAGTDSGQELFRLGTRPRVDCSRVQRHLQVYASKLGDFGPAAPSTASSTVPFRGRAALTNPEVNSPAGAELLTLLSGITEDGSVSDGEIKALREWLHLHADNHVGAIKFLVEHVERIVRDRVVTEPERKSLHAAIERVLPPEVRAISAARRTEHAAVVGRQVAMSAPVAGFDFMVAGVLYEDRAKLVREFATASKRVYLVREPANRHSPNAVRVVLPHGMHIGYVPETDAVQLAPLLDSGHRQAASIKKILAGTRCPIPVVIAEIYLPDSPAEWCTITATRPEAVTAAVEESASAPPVRTEVLPQPHVTSTPVEEYVVPGNPLPAPQEPSGQRAGALRSGCAILATGAVVGLAALSLLSAL